MTPERPEKKSEMIRFRVPWSLKQRFLARARREGRSASDLFRDYMEDYLRRPVQRPKPQALETAMRTVRRHPRPAFAAILGAAGISALLAGAIPAGAAPDWRAQFERTDANGDGAVSVNELQGAISIRRYTLRPAEPQDDSAAAEIMVVTVDRGSASDLVLLDPEGRAADQLGADGALTLRRVDHPAETALKRDFERFDADGDGSLSLAEFGARRDAMVEAGFAALDPDGDGVIGAEEQNAFVDRMNASLRLPDGDRPGARAMRRVLTALDADGDGQITRTEYVDAH